MRVFNFRAHLKNGLAVLFGIFLCIVLIACTEWVLKWTKKNPSVHTYITHQPMPYWTADRFGINTALPGRYQVQKIRESLTSGQKRFIFNVHYTINQFGYRETPIEESETRDKQAIFLGDSFTFGEGLNDNETIPYYFAQQAVDYAPYNFGVSGDSPFDILAKAENYQFEEMVPYKKGVVIYTLLNRYLYRVKGDMAEMEWAANHPYYVMRNGEVCRKGSFLTGRPLLTRALMRLKESEILRRLNKKHLLPIADRDFKLMARTIETAFHIFGEKFPDAKLYLVVYPLRAGEIDHTRQILKYLDGTKIKILDYSALFSGKDSRYFIAGDGHPTAYANQVFTEKLLEDLGLDK